MMKYSHHRSIFFCFGVQLISLVQSLIMEVPMPDLLRHCYRQRRVQEDLTITPGFIIQANCIDKYIWNTVESRYSNHSVSRNFINWIRSLDRESIALRQSLRHRPNRIRREIRLLSESERNAFFQAVNDLKNDKTIEPNVYDAFAMLHQGVSIRAAHYGTNFLSWHRVYLYYFELALRRKNPTVTLPYWDSSLDSGMDDPTQSIIFSRGFLGNGDGSVEQGPFGNWVTLEGGPISRDVGCPGEIVPKEREQFITQNMSVSHHWQITDGSIEPLRNTIEGLHNQVHSFIGGTMGQLEASPQDPIFYLHHAYVDYVWELFRRKQIALGINPEQDYDGIGGIPHAPFAPMYGFPWVSNIDGFSNIFTTHEYQYEKSPECPDCGLSPFLECSLSLQRCVSVSRSNYLAFRERQNKLQTFKELRPYRLVSNNPHYISPKAYHQLFLERIQSTGGNCNYYRKKRHAKWSIGHRTYVDSPSLPRFGETKKFFQRNSNSAILNSIFTPVTNSFRLDGVEAVERWSFAPVKVVYNRYRPFEQVFVSPQARFQKCWKYDKMNLNKIFVRSDGFNYRGEFSNSIVVDQFRKNVEVYLLMALKNPILGYGVSYITAFDVYGRACKPTCILPGSHPPVYRPCSGVLHTTSGFPDKYEYSYSDAVKKIRRLNRNKSKCETFMIFYCDGDTEWFWR